MTQRRLFLGLGYALLVLGLTAAAACVGYPYYLKAKADQQEIAYADYVRLGRERITSPIYRMGPMIELQCEVTADFILNRGEERRILELAARLKKKPERVHEHLLVNCLEWEKRKKIAG